MPRPPKSVTQLKKDVSHRSYEDLEQREMNEPRYQTQNFICPPELVGAERDKWEELAQLLRDMISCPISDADTDTMINYCKNWVTMIEADKAWRANPKYYIQEQCGFDKNGEPKYVLKINENYVVRRDSMNLLAKLKSDLMLDVLSRARMGSVRTAVKKEEDLFDKIMNRRDE